MVSVLLLCYVIINTEKNTNIRCTDDNRRSLQTLPSWRKNKKCRYQNRHWRMLAWRTISRWWGSCFYAVSEFYLSWWNICLIYRSTFGCSEMLKLYKLLRSIQENLYYLHMQHTSTTNYTLLKKNKFFKCSHKCFIVLASCNFLLKEELSLTDICALCVTANPLFVDETNITYSQVCEGCVVLCRNPVALSLVSFLPFPWLLFVNKLQATDWQAWSLSL